jgi:hypothetical protein
MGGFDGLINGLARIPLAVNRALPLIERGQLAPASDQLEAALVAVELGKAAILGNLALAALKAGDVGKCTGYVDIALQSMSELGLEETELGKMLALVHANLPADTAGSGSPAASRESSGDSTGEGGSDASIDQAPGEKTS